MSQEKTPYETSTPATLTAFKNRPCALPYSDENYQPPTPDEVTALIKICCWSQRQAAELVGVKFDEKKGSTTIRKWRAPIDKKENRPIPYAAWRLMLLHAGVVELDQPKIKTIDETSEPAKLAEKLREKTKDAEREIEKTLQNLHNETNLIPHSVEFNPIDCTTLEDQGKTKRIIISRVNITATT